MNIIGDVKGKNVILIDDMIDTAGTIVNAAKALKEIGAKEVYACCTHGVFSGPAASRIKDSEITELVVLDSINLSQDMKALEKVTLLSVAPAFSEAIRRIFNNDSVSTMFED
jgi:ribose-phosphate pyrophosphokinase